MFRVSPEVFPQEHLEKTCVNMRHHIETPRDQTIFDTFIEFHIVTRDILELLPPSPPLRGG